MSDRSSHNRRATPCPQRLPTSAAATRTVCSFSASERRRLVEQKLTDELFQHNGRLRLGDHAAVGQHLRVAARVETDVDLPQQSRRPDRADRVLAERLALIDAQRHYGAIGLRI